MMVEGKVLCPITPGMRAEASRALPTVPREPGITWVVVRDARRRHRYIETAWRATYADATMTQFARWECLNALRGEDEA
jgi:hypothetical protein